MTESGRNHWHRVLTVADMIQPAEYLILTLPDEQLPMKFHPQVISIDGDQLGLKLPFRWWQFFEFTPGMTVRLSLLHPDGVFFITGLIKQVNFNKQPNLLVAHDNAIKRDQRRFFYRVNVDQEIVIKELVFPEGQRIMNCPARISDISAGGLGLTVEIFLPPGTVLTLKDLLVLLLEEPMPREDCQLQVVWCRKSKRQTYRIGACFNYADVRAQDEMVKMINQVQRLKLIKYPQVRGARK